MRNQRSQDKEKATWVALNLLNAIARDPLQAGWFMQANGLSPHTLRASADDPRFLAMVVDYVADDAQLVLGLMNRLRLTPADIAQAQHILRDRDGIEAA